MLAAGKAKVIIAETNASNRLVEREEKINELAEEKNKCDNALKELKELADKLEIAEGRASARLPFVHKCDNALKELAEAPGGPPHSTEAPHLVTARTPFGLLS